jgi:hypothetical protein
MLTIYGVRKNGKRYDVVNVTTGHVMEGGFFTRDAAEQSAHDWNNEANSAIGAACRDEEC